MRYPVYTEWQSIDAPPLNRLPAHWRWRRLRFLTERIEQGWSPQCDNLPADEDAWGVMKVGCVNGHGFDASENKALPLDLAPLPEYELQPGDVLVSRANTRELVGSAALVPQGVRPRLLLCDKLFRLRPVPGIQPAFLVYLLRTPAARFHYERDATGASGSMQNIGQDTLKGLVVPLPPEEEQQHIANFLGWKTGQVDALIAKKQALLDVLTEKRRALIAGSITSGPSREAAGTFEAWFGSLPRGWSAQRVKFIGRVGNGSTPSRDDAAYWYDGNYPWLNSSVVNQASLTAAEQFVTETALRECHLPKIDPPAVLVGITGQGKTRGMASTLMFEATINQHLAFVKPDESVMHVDYLRLVFDAAYAYLRSESEGGGSTKGAITCEQIAEMPLPVPPLAEQRRIAAAVRRQTGTIDAMSMKTQLAIARLTEYRSALVTAATTGQIDVRGVAVPPAA